MCSTVMINCRNLFIFDLELLKTDFNLVGICRIESERIQVPTARKVQIKLDEEFGMNLGSEYVSNQYTHGTIIVKYVAQRYSTVGIRLFLLLDP
jgi:hypothetical protein